MEKSMELAKNRISDLVKKADIRKAGDSRVVITGADDITCPYVGDFEIVRAEVKREVDSNFVEISWFTKGLKLREKLTVRHNFVGSWEDVVVIEGDKKLECEVADDVLYQFNNGLFDSVERHILN